MSFLSFARRAVVCFCWVLTIGAPVVASAQTNYYRTNGTEYAIIGSLPGDQVYPDVAVTPTGGFVVWQDNATDGSGWGVSARRLDSTLSGTLSTFRVNVQGTNDQQNPRLASLKSGGAAFVWQGGQEGFQKIYARFLTSSNTWMTTNDVPVNSPSITNVSYVYGYYTNTTTTITTNPPQPPHQTITYTTNTTTTVTATITTNTSIGGTFRINPAVAVLNNSNVVVVWASYNQAGSNSLLDVYGQLFSPAGQKVGGEFLVNQFTAYNQRSPVVAALPNNGFIVAWVSEQQRASNNSLSYAANTNGVAPAQTGTPSVDVYARFYDGNGVAQGSEFLVNTDYNPCANPGVAVAADGSFMVTWSARDASNQANGWDVYARPFSSAGIGGAVLLVNSFIYGDQYQPRISAIGGDYLIVWTSMGQDGSREGVFGQFVHEDGSMVGGEFRVNTTTAGQQMQPVVTSDGAEQFLVVWTGFTFTLNSMDLFAQRYVNVAAVLQPMSAPFVYAPFVVGSNGLYQPQLQVSWSALAQQGISVSNYEVYVNGAGTPAVLTVSNVWMMTAANGLTASSNVSFTVDYRTTDGRRSPISPSASGKTWSGLYWGSPSTAIPDEWMTMYFGQAQYLWPSTTADSDGDGMNNFQEFLAGTIPTNSASVLRVQISQAAAAPQAGQSPPQTPGVYLSWNTQPGLTYQVQVTTNFTSWSNLGSPRFAAESSDSIFVGSGAAGYYRVLLLRQ